MVRMTSPAALPPAPPPPVRDNPAKLPPKLTEAAARYPGGRVKINDIDDDKFSPEDQRFHHFEHKQTSVAEAGVTKPAGVPSSIFEAGRMAKPVNPPKRSLASYEERVQSLADATVERGVPMAAKDQHTVLSKCYAKLLDGMREGDSVLLPVFTAKGLITHARKKRSVKMVCRKTESGQFRVWHMGSMAAGKGAA
jgi:hypothetical protein